MGVVLKKEGVVSKEEELGYIECNVIDLFFYEVLLKRLFELLVIKL